jgi:muramidase (phage lysozyme)
LKGSTSEGSKDFGKFNQEVMKSADIFVDLNKQMTDFNNKLNLASPGSGGSGGGSFSTGFGGGGDSVPVYHSGGIGDDTSAPGRLTGSGHSGRGSGISHSGLGGGGGSGGDDSGKAYGAAKAGSVAAAIFAGESKGDYSIYNYNGGRGVGHMDFSKMTVGEVMEAQRQSKVFAAGAYQVIPKTLSGAVNSLGLDPNTKFDKATQDKIFSGYLATSKKGRGALEDYIKGKSDNSDAALKAAAQEWASIQYHGHGIYDKDGINHGGISDARFLGAMKNARDLYSKSHNYQGALFGEASEETKAAAASYGPKTRSQSLSEATREMPHRPASSSNHIGDMSQYQHDKVPSITIMNKSGSNVNLQTASLGSVQGNFSS